MHGPLSLQEFRETCNAMGKQGIPFYFLTNFDLDENWVIPAENLEESPLDFSFHTPRAHTTHDPQLIKFPVEKSHYETAFNQVMHHLNRGDTFLINLTQPSTISLNTDLTQIFEQSQAPYKLLWRDRFVVFSPETFIRISGNTITSHPMKGTISASVPNAKNRLLESEKESAEHATIVDLIRNDLSVFCDNVEVTRYKYLEKIHTQEGDIWQMSSEITGKISNFPSQIGNILTSMLPAGSVSGAPKSKTIEIIKSAEKYDRGFYCGVAGYFDGQLELDSCVLIRFIEKTKEGYIFKSGGGITHMSNMEEEYEELIHKIYVPFH